MAELKAIVDKLVLIQSREGTIGPKNLDKPPDFILKVQQIVSRNSHVNLKNLTSLPKRGREKFSDARMIGLALCGKYKLANTYEISHRFGRKCHSSVSHATKRAAVLKQISANFNKLYGACDKEVKKLVNAGLEPEWYI